MLAWNRDSFTTTISLTCAVFSITTKSRMNTYIGSIYWPVFISSYLSGYFWIEFTLLSLTCPRRHQQSSNQLWYHFQANIYSKLHFWVVIFYGLNGTWIAREDEHNIQSRHCISSGFVILAFLANNQFIFFFGVTSVPHLKPLCCIYGIPVLYIIINLIRLLSRPWTFLNCPIFHHLFDNIYALFSVMLWYSFSMNI